MRIIKFGNARFSDNADISGSHEPQKVKIKEVTRQHYVSKTTTNIAVLPIANKRNREKQHHTLLPPQNANNHNVEVEVVIKAANDNNDYINNNNVGVESVTNTVNVNNINNNVDIDEFFPEETIRLRRSKRSGKLAISDD